MRSSTENIYQQKVNQVIDYISSRLHEPLQLNVMASSINVSQRQLLRIMHSALNESLYSYVARQRVERAVLYMQTEEMNLTKLAGMVGYDNPQSFSKAFKKQFGISPKAYMNELQSRLTGYVKSSGNRQNHLQSEICEEGDLELVYIRIIGKYGEDEPYEIAWNKLIRFLKDKQVLSKETRFIGLSFDDPNITKSEYCRFYACASVKKKIIPTGEFGTIQLRKGKYAVYTLIGGYSGLQELYNNISVNFDYTLRHGMAFEEYISCSEENSKEQITKVYIPIK
ncbi:MAG: AraC family transcriptional regulator [Tannerellaceae bacterium]|jgi:AraC-like DNA-binding protein/DNA gyrase inhibitor GyrI|nr:AraC family transcriptional regulator [Tannerellaceae bacterium]